jgi:hypothetical protein
VTPTTSFSDASERWRRLASSAGRTRGAPRGGYLFRFAVGEVAPGVSCLYVHAKRFVAYERAL